MLPEREPNRKGAVAKPTTQDSDQHMKTKNKYVGVDVHKDTTVIAVADGGRDGEVRLYSEVSSDLGALDGARAPRRRSPERSEG